MPLPSFAPIACFSCALNRRNSTFQRYLMLSRKLVIITLLLMMANVSVRAQGNKTQPLKQSQSEQKESAATVAKARTDLIRATNEYKTSLKQLLVFYERNIRQATERQNKLKELYTQGIIAKREFEESQKAVTDARAKADEVRKQIEAADVLIAQTLEEAKVEEQIAKAPPLPTGGFVKTPAYIRYNGPGRWALSDAVKVQSFFYNKTGRTLPVSAFGQTAVHDRLGFDHRNAMDVAVHPDSPEGQALIAYLRSAGVPFLAFRHAIPGSATGPHIHVGKPSHRISAPNYTTVRTP